MNKDHIDCKKSCCVGNTEQEEFRKELLKHTSTMYHFAFTLTRNHPDAEDLTQESILKALRNYKQFSKGSNIKAWLLTIVRNSFINLYRKQQKKPASIDINEVAPIIPSKDKEHVQYEINSDTAKLDKFEDEMEEKIKYALNELPLQFKQIFLLAVVENFSYKEISDLLEIPIGTVMSRLFRARKNLYEKLKGFAGDFGFSDSENN